MGILRQVGQYGSMRLARKLSKAVPVLGAVVALLVVRQAVRRKGMVKGLVDSSLDATPGVGTVKNLYEVARGRDVIPDRTASAKHRR